MSIEMQLKYYTREGGCAEEKQDQMDPWEPTVEFHTDEFWQEMILGLIIIHFFINHVFVGVFQYDSGTPKNALELKKVWFVLDLA